MPTSKVRCREFLLEHVDAGARRHRRGDGDDLVVLLGFLDQALAEHLGVLRRAALGLGLGAGGDVELDDAVILVGRALGRRVALALLRHDVDQDRAEVGVAHIAQHRQQVVEIVAVDRADVIEAELLEQSAAGDIAARVLDGAGDGAVERLRQMLGQLLADVAELEIGAAGGEAREVGRHGADRRRDRHLVVVEDDDQPLVAGAGIVHRLVGHAGRHRAVADHRDDVVVAAGEVAGDGHAERRRRSRSRNARRRTGRIRSRRAW